MSEKQFIYFNVWSIFGQFENDQSLRICFQEGRVISDMISTHIIKNIVIVQLKGRVWLFATP